VELSVELARLTFLNDLRRSIRVRGYSPAKITIGEEAEE
jgi:hypothetical protein